MENHTSNDADRIENYMEIFDLSLQFPFLLSKHFQSLIFFLFFRAADQCFQLFTENIIFPYRSVGTSDVLLNLMSF